MYLPNSISGCVCHAVPPLKCAERHKVSAIQVFLLLLTPPFLFA
jgi:hypothetical protein